MRIGIVADTHDRLRYIHKAVEIFNDSGVQLVLHGGDFVAPFALTPLKHLKMDWLGVLGNNDGEVAGLLEMSEGRIKGRRLEQIVGGRSILVVHEEGEARGGGAYPSGVDVVIFGHTHEPAVERQGETLVVNPGECCGYLGNRATVALLDTDTLQVELVDVLP